MRIRDLNALTRTLGTVGVIGVSLGCVELGAALPAESGLEGRIDALVQPYVNAGMFNGVILVAEGDRVLLEKGYGQANYEFGISNQPATRFRIASLSKQFTNAAIGVLMDRGRITPATLVSEFLPEFPRSDEITIAHLIDHRSGVPHTNDLEELDGVTHTSLPEMLTLLATKPLDFDPGTEKNYSNGGYDILAALVERASGKAFETFLAEDVFAPLDLVNSGTLRTYAVVPDLAGGYVPGTVPGGRSHARFYPSELRIGGGGLYSNAHDVYVLFRSTFQRQFAAETAPKLLFWDSNAMYEITGRAPGFVAKVFIDIPQDITIVSLANNYAALARWGRRLYQAAIDDPWETASINWIEQGSSSDEAASYEGEYASPWDRGTIAIGKNGHLQYEDEENDWRVALLPLGSDRYLHPFFDTICRFESNGSTDSLVCRPVLTRIDESTTFVRVRD